MCPMFDVVVRKYREDVRVRDTSSPAQPAAPVNVVPPGHLGPSTRVGFFIYRIFIDVLWKIIRIIVM